jgi:membrane protease YdiL (CAAX protease family)
LNALFRFLRSVLPADLFQLVFLAGIVCLIVSRRLRWWPSHGFEGIPQEVFNSPSSAIRELWISLLSIGVWPIMFSALAGYFVCFWPGNRPVRRVVLAVCLPVSFVIALLSISFIYFTDRPLSVLESTSDILRHARSWPARLWTLGPGLHLCLLGIVLIAVFAFRLASGKSHLPLAVAPNYSLQSGSAAAWDRIKPLIWVQIGPIVLATTLFYGFAVVLPALMFPHGSAYLRNVWFTRSTDIVDAALLLGVTFFVTGREGWRTARQAIRIPRPNYFLLGAALPILVNLTSSLGSYLLSRMQWAAGNRWHTPPQLVSYFAVPDVWLLLLFFAALAEEIIFRGLLQPQFIERYGLYRGIFLVSMVWAAFHFWSDSYGASEFGVLEQLSYRICICLAWGFVLSWITLRCGSVLPAAIAHTLSNVFIFSQPLLAGAGLWRLALWSGLGYALFYRWPISETTPSDEVLPDTAPQPSV